ncbi:hypothetical protein RFI_04005 [Reticulomyxa filosa]|uniref:C2 domain-containing protein n=1 Tax=Reticulomyxa filosa TaxID=46433 RepID=X6P4Q3_RETFI|nr:hypothetical protein RFI_04005 [Reticulomyxa filosa]|eukprot:ETO33103.1 hypothetical protein RFI_04005 [Reticulomyxa filosa]
MGGACCTQDQRPVLRIFLKRGEDLPAEDDNGESDAYVVFHYGDINRSRFETKRSDVITTKGGHCTWDEVFEFPFGSLNSTQILELQLDDRDILKPDDISGGCRIYYGKHPQNPKNTDKAETNDHQQGNEDAKYFLPLEWNVEEHHVIQLTDENDLESGKIHLSITLVNPLLGMPIEESSTQGEE